MSLGFIIVCCGFALVAVGVLIMLWQGKAL